MRRSVYWRCECDQHSRFTEKPRGIPKAEVGFCRYKQAYQPDTLVVEMMSEMYKEAVRGKIKELKEMGITTTLK